MHEPDLQNLTDAELLRSYIQSGSRQAFGEIVERHIALVHTSAMRQCTNDPHAACDVTQVVFMLLAHKAPRINPNSVLSGWLIRATCFAARSHRRAESRRKRHEARAAAARAREDASQVRDTNESNIDPTLGRDLWNRMSPVIDELLGNLPSPARDVLALRFMEGNTYAQISRRLGTTEEAARKRAERGLSALRAALARRGIHTYHDALEAALLSAAPVAVPVALARAVAEGAGQTPHHTLIVKGAIKIMAWTKAKIAVASVAAALLVTGGGMLAHHLVTSSQSTFVVPLPASSNLAVANDAHRRVSLQSARVARGRVQTEAGDPVSGAHVFVSLSARQMDFLELNPDLEKGLKPPPVDQQSTTDADGHFEFAVSAAPSGAVVLAPEGAAVANASELVGTEPLVVRPYGRIEGTLSIGHKPIEANRELLLTTGMQAQSVRFSLRALTDPAGHFAIENVPPGSYQLFVADQNGRISIAPGQTAHLDIDPVPGAALVGKLEGMKMPAWAMFIFTEPRSATPATAPQGAFVRESWQFNFYTQSDGSFRIDKLPAGTYHLLVNVLTVGQPIGLVERDFEVPAALAGQPSRQVDLGTLKLQVGNHPATRPKPSAG